VTVAAVRHQRSQGHVALAVEHHGLSRLREQGAAKVRFPEGTHEAVLINTGGGLAGGDEFSFDIAAGADARLTVTTQAAERVYRTLGPPAVITATLKAGRGAFLAWLPQETILFDRARIVRRIDIDLAADASLLLCEIVVFGRAAMGEKMLHGEFIDRWRLRRGGRLVFAETVRLDGDIGEKLARPAVANGGVAIGTALIVPGDEALVERIREASETFGGEVGISSWNGFAMARFCAQDAARLRADMMAVLGRASGVALPRLWLN
jgi:urease accessory protein